MLPSAIGFLVSALLTAAFTSLFFQRRIIVMGIAWAISSAMLGCLAGQMIYDSGFCAGQGTLLTQQDLSTAILYETIGQPVTQPGTTTNTTLEYLAFLKTREGDAKAYRLAACPPSRFCVIRDEQTRLDFLPRSLPAEQPSP